MVILNCMIVVILFSFVLLFKGFWNNNVKHFWSGAFLCFGFSTHFFLVITSDLEIEKTAFYPIKMIDSPSIGKVLYYNDEHENVCLIKNIENYKSANINFSNYDQYQVSVKKFKSFYYLIYIKLPNVVTIESKSL